MFYVRAFIYIYGQVFQWFFPEDLKWNGYSTPHNKLQKTCLEWNMTRHWFCPCFLNFVCCCWCCSVLEFDPALTFINYPWPATLDGLLPSAPHVSSCNGAPLRVTSGNSGTSTLPSANGLHHLHCHQLMTCLLVTLGWCSTRIVTWGWPDLTWHHHFSSSGHHGKHRK